MVTFRPPAWTWLLWTEIPFSICSKRKGFAHRYRLRIKGLKWFTGLYQILSEFGHFKATWSVMYTFKDRYQSNPTAVHPPPTRPTCPESTSDQPVYIKLSFQFIQRLNSTGNDRYSDLIILWHFQIVFDLYEAFSRKRSQFIGKSWNWGELRL